MRLEFGPAQEAETLTALCVKVLNAEGRLRAPKLSVSLLARPTASPNLYGPLRLSGYGRLGDANFTPIQPRPADPQQSSDLSWERVAGLQTLDRADLKSIENNEADPFEYDVVVYGPGGELLPTRP